MVLDVWYIKYIGNPIANVYQNLMAMNPHVQHSYMLLFRELLVTSWLYSEFQSKASKSWQL